MFQDIFSLTENEKIFREIISQISLSAKKNKVTKVIGIEARGFIFASAVAFKNKIGFIPIRKKGKLPGKIYTKKYKLEYGYDEIEIQQSPVDMGRFLPQILGQFESLRQGRILQLKAPDPAPHLVTDERKLRQILNNLLGNALKFTPTPGTITLSLSEASDHYILAVEDTGIGIPLDQQGLIFERFTQVDHAEQKRHRGTGLGLAISKSLAERMGYTLKVSSTPGEGTVFSLIIPFSTLPTPSS